MKDFVKSGMFFIIGIFIGFSVHNGFHYEEAGSTQIQQINSTETAEIVGCFFLLDGVWYSNEVYRYICESNGYPYNVADSIRWESSDPSKTYTSAVAKN